MKYGIQEKHPDLGQEFTWDREGKPSISGVCDRVEIQPAIFRNVKTSKQTANEKIRLRLRPAVGRAVWSVWFPHRAKA